jgi:hypothetical protein
MASDRQSPLTETASRGCVKPSLRRHELLRERMQVEEQRMRVIQDAKSSKTTI